MFDRVIPSWEAISKFKQPLTEGELHLVRFLDQYLKKDSSFHTGMDLSNYKGWLIFVQPFLNGSRPDIILFNPFVGIQIIEVKDVKLDSYYFNSDTSGRSKLFVSTKDGNYSCLSPIDQIKYYKSKLVSLLPQIGEKIDSNATSFGLIKISIYFHNAKTKDAQNLFSSQANEQKFFPIFGRDTIDREELSAIVPDHYRTYSQFWQKEWNKEVLFWLNPPFHSMQQGTELNLNNNQQKFAEPQKGHFRIRGVAGSGKTQVLAYRAGKLASQGYSVLILSFNITLWHYIRDMIQRTPFDFSWQKIKLDYFHGFCRDILIECEKDWPENDQNIETFFKEVIPSTVIEAIEKGGFAEKYDAILIDEGQDYYLEWYHMLCRFLTERDEFVVVCDKKQNIYDREMEWLDKRRRGMEKFGDWIELKTIIRLPEAIAEVAKQFSEGFNLN